MSVSSLFGDTKENGKSICKYAMKKKKGFEDSLFFSSFFKPVYCSLQGIFIVVKSGLAYSSGSDLFSGQYGMRITIGTHWLVSKADHSCSSLSSAARTDSLGCLKIPGFATAIPGYLSSTIDAEIASWNSSSRPPGCTIRTVISLRLLRLLSSNDDTAEFSLMGCFFVFVLGFDTLDRLFPRLKHIIVPAFQTDGGSEKSKDIADNIVFSADLVKAYAVSD
nr:hypothetical protein Iba_chr08dCG4420 [Ipomoea batatas]